MLSDNQEYASEEENIFANFIMYIDKPKCLIEAPEEIKHFSRSWMLASSAYIPLSAKGSVGVLIFSSSDAQKFDPNIDTQFLERVGHIVSTAIDNACAFQNESFTQHE